MLCDQNPEQSKRNHSEDERRGKKKWKEREGEEKEVEVEERLEEEQEKEEKNEEQYPQKRLVSKPLMDTLWATFKLNKCPTKGDSQSLAFEFNMTAKQQWFCKRRKKYNKAMYKQKPKKRPKRLLLDMAHGHGCEHGYIKPELPDYKQWKIKGKPLESVQEKLAARGLRDPWGCHEAWRCIGGFANSVSFGALLKQFKYGFAAFVVAIGADSKI
ncbi:hypothetical protein GH733_014553 [Mirounga leonina]|nr:hypothetical protein GH733_014553 [Mirounga leonina]